MKRHWLRGVIGGLGFTSALFIFQACYGMAGDYSPDMLVEGKVSAKTTGLPIKDILVSAEPFGNAIQTDEMGGFSFYTPYHEKITLIFEDQDSTENGSFQTLDTIINVPEILDSLDRVLVDIKMEEK